METDITTESHASQIPQTDGLSLNNDTIVVIVVFCLFLIMIMICIITLVVCTCSRKPKTLLGPIVNNTAELQLARLRALSSISGSVNNEFKDI